MPLADIMSIWHRNTSTIGLESENPLDKPEILPNIHSSWQSRPESDDFSDDDSTKSSLNDEGVQLDATGFQQYLDCLDSSATYKWLLATLKRQALLAAAVPDVREKIRWKILTFLARSKNKVSRKASSEAHTALFQVKWDPASFVKEQKYNANPDAAIASAITITGSVQDAQALTTGQYLSQTWDSLALLRVIQEVLCRKPGRECAGKSSADPT